MDAGVGAPDPGKARSNLHGTQPAGEKSGSEA
jgi:hypothetical protein